MKILHSRYICRDCGDDAWIERHNCWVCDMCGKTHGKSSSESNMTVEESYIERAKRKFEDIVTRSASPNLGYGEIEATVVVNGIFYRCKGVVSRSGLNRRGDGGYDRIMKHLSIERQDEESIAPLKRASERCAYCSNQLLVMGQKGDGIEHIREYYRGVFTGLQSRIELLANEKPENRLKELLEMKSQMISHHDMEKVYPTVKPWIRDLIRDIDEHIVFLSPLESEFIKELMSL